MAYASGYAANRRLLTARVPAAVAHSINEGISDGFEFGSPVALIALIIMGWAQ